MYSRFHCPPFRQFDSVFQHSNVPVGIVGLIRVLTVPFGFELRIAGPFFEEALKRSIEIPDRIGNSKLIYIAKERIFILQFTIAVVVGFRFAEVPAPCIMVLRLEFKVIVVDKTTTAKRSLYEICLTGGWIYAVLIRLISRHNTLKCSSFSLVSYTSIITYFYQKRKFVLL